MNPRLPAALLLAALLAPAVRAAEPAAPPVPADRDGDGLAGAADPEPTLSNLGERFVYQLESPVLTWELDQEQFTRVEKTTEHVEAQIESLRQAAQEVLSETTGESRLKVDEKARPEPGWMQLSVNPLAMLGALTSGRVPLEALAAGIRVGAQDGRKQTEEEKHEFSVLKRVAREERSTREELAERRTRLLQIQRFTRVLRNPQLRLSLHLRNGGGEPLVVERPEVPVLAGNRMLGVAVPLDPRDRERVVIPPGRSQAILLSVPVNDTDFWDALNRGADQIRYEPLLGPMRVHTAAAPDADLLALVRDSAGRCVPVSLYLPEGAVMEQALARLGEDGKPVTARAAIEEWNKAWRRQHPDAPADLIRTDDAGQIVAAAGRTGSPLGAGWQVEVDGKVLQPGDPTDVPVTASLKIRWSDIRPLFEPLAEKLGRLDKGGKGSTWMMAGLAAFTEYRRLHRGAKAEEVIASIEGQLQGDLGRLVPPEQCGPLLTTLGEAHRLAGDIEAAKTHWEKAAKYGDPQAILALAKLALDIPGRIREGVTRLRQAAAAGSPEAMTRLADVELQPGGDPGRALLLIGQAAEAGHAPALTALGLRYESGEGLPRDTAQAASLYAAASGRGDSAAMLRLGMLYETGQGVPRDLALAADWYRAAACGQPLVESPPPPEPAPPAEEQP